MLSVFGKIGSEEYLITIITNANQTIIFLSSAKSVHPLPSTKNEKIYK